MGRREDFARTMRHEKPENLIIDFGGNPLSSMEGESENKLLEFLGLGKKQGGDLPFGKTRRLDERLLRYFDIDTRSVGEIFTPQDSHFQTISETEYIDEWGIRRRFTGLYWESVNTPLKGATLEELNAYRFPDPDSIDERQIAAHAARAKELYETTDYVICAEHPVYGIFELGCWMCGFEDFLYRMALDEEWIHRFFERVLEEGHPAILHGGGAVHPLHVQRGRFCNAERTVRFTGHVPGAGKAVFQGAHRLYQAFYKGEIPAPFLRKRIQADRRPGGLRR